MQTSSKTDPAAAREKSSGFLWWIFLGSAFVLNGYIADALYPANRPAGDVSAAIGALLLAAPIFRTAIRDLLRAQLRMNELVALAVLAALVSGDFKTAGLVAFFMLIAQVIETRTAEGAHASIESLIRMSPTRALRLFPDGGQEEVAAEDLKVGDRVRVLPGDNIPADGEIQVGQTTINESTVTGESLPRDKGPGEDVYAGTQNLTGAVELVVRKVGEDTTLGRVRQLILEAEQTRLPIMSLIDRYVVHYTPVVLMLAGMVWFFTNDWSRVIALLVIACPCAVILATPTAMVAALSAAARMGILIKDLGDLEAAARLDAFVFDKTGTLTTGQLGVSRLAPQAGVEPQELLTAAASAEQYSKHPAAAALQTLAQEVELTLSTPEGFKETPGRGIEANIEGQPVLVGRMTWLRERGIAPPETTEEEPTHLSLVHVARSGRYLGWIGLQDQLRPESRRLFANLREQRVRRIAMVTGDRKPLADIVAKALGSDEYRAECLPEEKVDYVRSVKEAGYRVAVVGDGVNDAPALAAGDTGIAMGAAGNDVAIHSATIALMNNDLRRIPFLLQLSRGARTIIHQNLSFALVFILGGLFLSGAGKLNPILAALIHNLGTLFVVFNSARLIRAGEELEAAAETPATAPATLLTADAEALS